MAMHAPFGRPVILTICPNNVFRCNFDAQHFHKCPHFLNFSSKNLPEFTSELVSFLRRIDFSHHISRQTSPATFRLKIPEYKETLLLLSSPLTSVAFTGDAEVTDKHLCNLQLREK